MTGTSSGSGSMHGRANSPNINSVAQEPSYKNKNLLGSSDIWVHLQYPKGGYKTKDSEYDESQTFHMWDSMPMQEGRVLQLLQRTSHLVPECKKHLWT